MTLHDAVWAVLVLSAAACSPEGSLEIDGGALDDAAPPEIDASLPDAGAGTPEIDASLPDAGVRLPFFDCADLATPAALCDDFNGAPDHIWTQTQGDIWRVVGDEYEGIGTQGPPAICDGSFISASVVEGFSAADVRVRGRITSVVRNDAVLVLRSVDESNRIELNFRAGDAGDRASFVGDLAVQDLKGCLATGYTDPTDPATRVLLPGNPRVGQPYDVEIQLRGQELRVWVNDVEVVFPNGNLFPELATDAGSVGFGVIASPAEGIERGRAHFDHLIVESLD